MLLLLLGDLLLGVLLAGYVSAPHVQVGAAVLALTGGDSIAGVVNVLFVDVSAGGDWHTLVGRTDDVFLVKTIEIRLFTVY